MSSHWFYQINPINIALLILNWRVGEKKFSAVLIIRLHVGVCNYLYFCYSQRVRPTIHDVITSNIKSYAREASKSNIDKVAKRTASDVSHSHGAVTRYQLPKQKKKNEASTLATQLVASPISPVMAPTGDAQHAASQLLGSIFECLVGILGKRSAQFVALSKLNPVIMYV